MLLFKLEKSIKEFMNRKIKKMMKNFRKESNSGIIE